MENNQNIIQDNLKKLTLYSTEFSLLNDLKLGNFENLATSLVNFGASYALSGDLWHAYIAYFIITNENAFSLASEYRELNTSNSLYYVAKSDLLLLTQIYRADLSYSGINLALLSCIRNFASDGCASLNPIITEIVQKVVTALDMSKDIGATISIAANVYKSCGVGDLGMHKAFKIIKTEELLKKTNTNIATILPITKTDGKRLNDIVGCDLQKQQLVSNTEAFLEGKQANNVLLYGDGGTGKSSSIKAILNEYYPKGLRIIEVYKHQFSFISDIIAQIKNRNYKFIIYLDDLSFEDFEIEYKYFKAIIDGGMEKKPDNVLIYATSNRRHLIKESFSDKNDMQFDGEMHKSDTTAEKLSLVSRFGLQIYFGAGNQNQYLEIVKQLAGKYHLNMDAQELERKALTWSIRNNGRSGRTAQQFINSLLS